MIRVLLVDDSSIAITILKRMLSKSTEIDVVGTAGNGREALKLIPLLKPDVICTDLHMPVMDGEEMLTRLRENDQYENLPVIVVSSESEPSKIEKMLKLGATFIHKPFTPEILKEVIIAVTGVNNEETD